MCGIFGLFLGNGSNLSAAQARKALADLFELSESRGREASGISFVTQSAIRTHKDPIPGTQLIHSKRYGDVFDAAASDFWKNGGTQAPFAAVGHSRLVTAGIQGIPSNNQPVFRSDIGLVHNGIVVNADRLWEDAPELQRDSEVDSEVIAALIEREVKKDGDLRRATRETFSLIEGETSVAVFFRDRDALILATNTGSLYAAVNPAGTAMFFASEAFICETLTSESEGLPGFAGSRIHEFGAGGAMVVDLTTLDVESFSLDEADMAAPAVSPNFGLNRAIETVEQWDRDAREQIRRCTRCILPETMPFIDFDEDGVCNYCRSHQPFETAGRDALEAQLDKHRQPNGAKDCVVAFSGGRDSSYGLHLLRTEFGMKPVAYTYDWGMVTDLGRRNQARMCGKLGVEHIWISADIRAKRANIRRNVEAWLRRPKLGLIPLFMAGDKQFFWYANKSIKRTGIDLMVFCDNPYEKTNFKIGFCGIRPYAKTNRPHVIGLKQKVQLALYYGANYALNPRYLNKSLSDTATAFAAYYVMPNSYLPLFQYTPWNEEVVDDVLISEYDWETAHDTSTTWRIGDGTAPFYNHVYYTVAGFSEHDTFRSMQVRENHIDRDKALSLVSAENQPRWDSIREYLQMIGVDFSEVMRIVNGMPRLYRES